MNKLVVVILSALLISLAACNDDNGDGDGPQVRQLWPRGSYPVPSPADERVLFTQEESPAGLYVLENGSASLLNGPGPEARSDYVWSPNGQRIAFSSPGEPGGEQAGIWLSTEGNITSFFRVWDRGSNPRFFPVENLLTCAGPEDDSEQEGIWIMDFQGENQQRITQEGVAPEVSPDGEKIAYLMTTAGSTGRTVSIYNRVNHVTDTTVAVAVLRHAWLSDSETLVYETMQNGAQEINFVGPLDDIVGVTVASGTAPSAMSSNMSFLFSRITGDRSAGIYRAAVGLSPTVLSTTGTNARQGAGNRVVAQTPNGLIEITF